MTKSILLVGVGGQGTILASKLLTIGLMTDGFDVKMSEIHGMSQRGGSVSSHVRYGKEVFSPVIEPGAADILVAFEKMECLRWLNHLKPEGQIIVNNQEINPMPVLTGRYIYETGIENDLKAKAQTTVIEANGVAEALGNLKVMNIVLLGAVVKAMNLKHIDWETIIRENVKERFVDINIQAFAEGLELA